METDQEYRSRLAVHPDFPKDEPFTLGKLAVAEGLHLDLVGAQLEPTCPRKPVYAGKGQLLAQAAEDIEAGQAVALGPDGKVRVARPAYMPWQFDGNKPPRMPNLDCSCCGTCPDCKVPDTLPGGAP